MSREAVLLKRLLESTPDLTVDLHLYATADGGKTMPISIGWGCPAFESKNFVEGWDAYPLLESAMMPGERRKVGLVFLSGLAAMEALSSSDCLYLWEGRLIGEARVIS